ncbi:3-oxoacid CoA-transferase subunit B [Breoghania sp.]|uniref:3-oxoacid CoA-transferase subunit B n=1 Tax=Breoghania sp. TaxID=2065378 RepID=UPI002AABD60E|nr:3-oxoacid CoA-transferase subunit B [Breoghania sp.]
MDKKQLRDRITSRVAKELEPGSLVNLGIGMPTLVASKVEADSGIQFQSENGMIGVGTVEPCDESIDHDITNAGGMPVSATPDATYFDSAMSFTLIRGGHVDASVLGALEVDASGSLANWIIPGKMVPGMGGAMDLVTGARRVIIAMEHCSKDGSPKILKECTLPLTAVGAVDLIVTERAVIKVTENGLVLTEKGEGFEVEDIIAATDAPLTIAEDLKTFG